jgi:uracil-DNA glycosylase
MIKDPDINKVVRQHLELEQFFAGFTVKSKKQRTDDSVQRTETAPGGQELNAESYTPNADIDKAAELAKIAEMVKSCCQCELGSQRTHAVPGEGNPDARIMFIGEAPGADEDAQGRPFVGRAGQLLDKIISGCGLRREDVFIANVLKCRPPDNRPPRADEVIQCLPFLQRQIEIIQPEIIVALGAHAAHALLNTTKSIGELRGHFDEYTPGLGQKPIKVMSTYHPSFLLRSYSPDNRRRVWEDMKKVLAELGLPVPEK